MDRPRRQRKIKKFDEDEFVEDMEGADLGPTRRVYRLLRRKDIKSSLKDTVVHILWPENGTWYQAEVEQLRVRDMRAHVRYPITNEEEDVDLQELIQEKCLAVLEHLAPDTKLKRGREVPASEEDAVGAEFETDDEPEETPPPPAAAAKGKRQGRGKAGAPRGADPAGGSEDEEYDAEQDSDAAPSDDEKLDSDADVSDDQPPSSDDDDSEAERAQAAGRRRSSGSGGGGAKPGKGGKQQQQQGKLNTPSRGSKPAARASTGGSIGPVAATGSGLPPGMMPLDATGAAASTGMKLAANGSGLWPAGSGDLEQQGVLGKRRGQDGPGSEAKRRASSGADAGSDDGGEQPAAGSDAFKKAMMEKLLAKKAGAGGGSGGGGGSGAPVRTSSRQLARGSSGVERRLSATGSAGSGLQRALSEVEVRQKAAGTLLAGLKKAVEEAQEKHEKEQQQTGQPQPQADAAAGEQQETGQQPGEAAAAAGADKGAAVLAADAPATAASSEQPATEQQQQQDMPPPPPQQQEQPAAGQEQQQPAVAELKLPDPQELAEQIEQELFNLCGSLNNDYKTKLRSLAFNLRDLANPDLRAAVLGGSIPATALVRMSATDLANKDLAEWRRKIEEEHNKAIELDVEAAAKFSTAAAWATREETLRKKELALMGILAAGARKGTPEPERQSPLHPMTTDGAANDKDAAATAAAAAGTGEAGGDAAVTAEEEEDAGHGTPTHPGADGGGGTPTRPASEDMEIDDPPGGSLLSPTAAAAGRGGIERSSSGGGGVGGSNDLALLQQQQSEQLSSLGLAVAAGGGAGEPSGIVASASLVLPAGSVAAAGPGVALQPIGSVTSKAPMTAALAGIDWAAIKSEALRSVPKKSQAADASAAATAAEAAAAAAGGADDAPYNPDDDEPSAAAQQPALDPDVPDLLPVVAARPGPGPAPLQQVWHGTFAVPGSGSFGAAVRHLGGLGDVGLMLGPPGGTLEVIGRVALDKFAGFAEELRKSRSRTISLGLVGAAAGAGGEGFMGELLRGYSSKGRIGKLGLAREVEGYLVARSDFTARLVKTAALVTPGHQQHLMPRDVDPGDFLLLLVHRKDYVPPASNAAPQQQQQQQQQVVPPPPPPPGEQQQMQQQQQAEPPHLDPRRRAAVAAGAGGPPPPPPAAAAAAAMASGQPGQPGVGLDLGSLSALAAALGLPGGAAGAPGPAPAPAAGPDAAAAAAPAAAGPGPGRGVPPPWAGGTSLPPWAGGTTPSEQQQQQHAMMANPAGLPGPPPPLAGPGPASGYSPAQGPGSGGLSGLQQQQQQHPPHSGDPHQQQQQFTIDMRLPPPGAGGPPGPDQVVFDLRQQQPGPPLLPPELGGGPLPLGPPGAGLPPAGSAGGAPVIILPPGAAVPAPGTPGIPDNAVFMTQDAATGALIPVGGGPLPPHLLAPPGVMPGPFVGGPGGPPPPPPPPPHHPHHHHRPRGPGGGPPRPMVRTMQPRQGGRY